MGTDSAIFRTLGQQTAMRTDQYNSRWLNGNVDLLPVSLLVLDPDLRSWSVIGPVMELDHRSGLQADQWYCRSRNVV